MLNVLYGTIQTKRFFYAIFIYVYFVLNQILILTLIVEKQ